MPKFNTGGPRRRLPSRSPASFVAAAARGAARLRQDHPPRSVCIFYKSIAVDGYHKTTGEDDHWHTGQTPGNWGPNLGIPDNMCVHCSQMDCVRQPDVEKYHQMQNWPAAHKIKSPLLVAFNSRARSKVGAGSNKSSTRGFRKLRAQKARILQRKLHKPQT